MVHGSPELIRAVYQILSDAGAEWFQNVTANRLVEMRVNYLLWGNYNGDWHDNTGLWTVVGAPMADLPALDATTQMDAIRAWFNLEPDPNAPVRSRLEAALIATKAPESIEPTADSLLKSYAEAYLYGQVEHQLRDRLVDSFEAAKGKRVVLVVPSLLYRMERDGVRILTRLGLTQEQADAFVRGFQPVSELLVNGATQQRRTLTKELYDQIRQSHF